MYSLNTSSKIAKSNKAFVEAMIANYDEKAKLAEAEAKAVSESAFGCPEGVSVLEAVASHQSKVSKYLNFKSTVASTLLVEAMCYLIKDAAYDNTLTENANKSIIRAMANEYVMNEGYGDILHRMETASITTSMIKHAIDKTTTKILESVDKDDPDTFHVTPEMKDDFYKQLDYSDADAISDAIKERVTDAMDDFVTANTKDHEDITDALNKAQEKIEKTGGVDEELNECYNAMAKREIINIRNRPKSVLHSMVEATCKSVLANKDMQAEFMVEGHLDMNKIVNRTKIMYAFIEMLNTSRIAKVDTAFIEGVISDLTV